MVPLKEKGRNDQELEEGLRTVAAPIHDGERAVAALSVSTFANRIGVRSSRGIELLDPLLETAAAINADLRATSQSR